MLICMLARERSQIIRVFCHNLLSFLLQVLAEFYLGISSVRTPVMTSWREKLYSPFFGLPFRAKTNCLPSVVTMALEGRAMHDWLPVAILPLTYIPSKSRAEP